MAVIVRSGSSEWSSVSADWCLCACGRVQRESRVDKVSQIMLVYHLESEMLRLCQGKNQPEHLLSQLLQGKTALCMSW